MYTGAVTMNTVVSMRVVRTAVALCKRSVQAIVARSLSGADWISPARTPPVSAGLVRRTKTLGDVA